PQQDQAAAALPGTIDEIRESLRWLGQQIARRYFVVLTPPRAVGGGRYADRAGSRGEPDGEPGTKLGAIDES
ncbi:hypothetical protein, partial [Nguyenibacter vanlangensis]